jgi:hypothetical protein
MNRKIDLPKAKAEAVLGIKSRWLLLTIPVLIAGLVRLRRGPLRAGPGAVAGTAWAGAWVAGVALMVQVGTWQPSAPAVYACSKNLGCSLVGYRHAVVSWGELAIFAGWLALGAAMALILARLMRGRDLCDAGQGARATGQVRITGPTIS